MNRALLARVEYLEAENLKLKEEMSNARLKHFRLEDIANNDSLIKFTQVFAAVFDFLGPAVNELHYWGTL